MAQPTPKSQHNVIDYLLTNVPTIGPEATVAQAVNLIRQKARWDTINYVYVLDPSKNLIGVVSIKELLRNKDSALIKNIMNRDASGISASTKAARAPIFAIEKNIKSVPVLKTGTKEFLGVIGADKILEILHQENIEQSLRFSGIVHEHPTLNIFKASTWQLTKARLPWLFIGLLGGMIGAFLVGRFEAILAKEIALAFFIPVVVYISNAVSTQTQALLLRLLATQKVRPILFFQKELAVSAGLALFSALVISVFSWLWLQSLAIAATVGLAIIMGTLISVVIAVTIPSILYSAKKDPALGTGPFATALQDIISLLVYLLVASTIIL